MKQITNDQSKIDLVARLVKEGSIDFNEAIQLLEVEVVTQIQKEFIFPPSIPNDRPNITKPWEPYKNPFRYDYDKNPLDPPYRVTMAASPINLSEDFLRYYPKKKPFEVVVGKIKMHTGN